MLVPLALWFAPHPAHAILALPHLDVANIKCANLFRLHPTSRTLSNNKTHAEELASTARILLPLKRAMPLAAVRSVLDPAITAESRVCGTGFNATPAPLCAARKIA